MMGFVKVMAVNSEGPPTEIELEARYIVRLEPFHDGHRWYTRIVYVDQGHLETKEEEFIVLDSKPDIEKAMAQFGY